MLVNKNISKTVYHLRKQIIDKKNTLNLNKPWFLSLWLSETKQNNCKKENYKQQRLEH